MNLWGLNHTNILQIVDTNHQIASKWAPEFFQCPSQEYLCISTVSDMAPAGAVRSWPSCKQGLLSRGWGATERHGNRTNHPTKALLGRAQCWKSSEWGACLCWPRPLSAEAKSVPPTSTLVQKGQPRSSCCLDWSWSQRDTALIKW